jgi:hypothetical protein
MVSLPKHRRGLVLLLVSLCPAIQSFQSVSVPPGPLPSTENLQYTIEWRLITAGKAQLTWTAAGGSGFHSGLHLESTGLVSKLFKVNDEYTSTLDENLCARSSLMKTQEGSRRRETKVTFDPERRKASYLERDMVKNAVLTSSEVDIPACVSDIIGGLYRMRTLNLDAGQTSQVPMSDGKKNAMVRVDALRRETVKTPAGSYRTMRYEASLFNDVLYRRSGRIYIWLTDDRRRLPVQVQVRLQLAIGTITVQLEKEGT